MRRFKVKKEFPYSYFHGFGTGAIIEEMTLEQYKALFNKEKSASDLMHTIVFGLQGVDTNDTFIVCKHDLSGGYSVKSLDLILKHPDFFEELFNDDEMPFYYELKLPYPFLEQGWEKGDKVIKKIIKDGEVTRIYYHCIKKPHLQYIMRKEVEDYPELWRKL